MPTPLETSAITANDAFKARWRRSLARSTALAFVLHVALFAFTTWRMELLLPDPTPFEGQALVMLPAAEERSAGGGETAPDIPLPDEVDVPLLEVAEGEGADPEPGYEDALRSILSRTSGRSALRPTLAEPELDDEEPRKEDEGDPPGSTEESPDIGGDATAIDLATLPEPDSLALDRLASLTPELALVTPSSWVLIRNPIEVENYLRRGYTLGRLDPGASGSVRVTLWIDERGSVEWAEVAESSGRRDLDEFALALFNEIAVFRPAREHGVRVSRSVSFALNFPWVAGG